QRDQAKELYGKAFSEAKQTQAFYAKLQRNIVRLSSRIKQARKVIRQQKKPLRILLTKATRQHKVKDIQQALVDLGYRVEKVDGLYGLETIAVIKKYQKANNLKVTGLINEKLIASIREKSGKDPLNAGHVYVRQGFRDVYDAPVGIAEPERALGTHFYSVLKFDKTDSQARWNVVTIKSRKQLAKVKSKPLATASVKTGQETSDAAKDALDRIVLPKKVSEFLSKRLTPGSSFIITDNGYSDETGKGTDFIVLAR
ncbi:MAG: peptidoglycan-binding protein, partial [Methyloligellaceae bacterium]